MPCACGTLMKPEPRLFVTLLVQGQFGATFVMEAAATYESQMYVAYASVLYQFGRRDSATIVRFQGTVPFL